MSFFDPSYGEELSATCDVCERALDHVNYEMDLELCDECAAEVRRLEKAERLKMLFAAHPEMQKRSGVAGVTASALKARAAVAAYDEANAAGHASGGVTVPDAHANRRLPAGTIMFPLANPMAGK